MGFCPHYGLDNAKFDPPSGNNFFDTLHGVDIFSTSWCFLLMVRLLCTAVNIC